MRNWNRLFFCVILIAIAGLVAGCTRDPNVRKREFFESGSRYYAKGQYQEAAIQFANAIHIDPKFEQAHYKLGSCDIRLRQWPDAYKELTRAVQLQPTDLKARLELGNLLLLGRQFQAAQAQAQQVLKQDAKSRRGTLKNE
jgi:Tfp pilus assembly protein PilF